MIQMLCLASSLAFAASGDGRMTFEIHSIEHDRGQVGCALFKGEAGFPMQADRAFRRLYAPITDGKATCTFDDLPEGEYALSVMHDEDGDGELDRGFFGPPTEGWGTSNDAPARAFGPPTWEKAKIAFEGTRFTQRIRMRY